MGKKASSTSRASGQTTSKATATPTKTSGGGGGAATSTENVTEAILSLKGESNNYTHVGDVARKLGLEYSPENHSKLWSTLHSLESKGKIETSAADGSSGSAITSKWVYRQGTQPIAYIIWED